VFLDRTDAGRKLSERIPHYPNSIVLAIPRGGVILGDIIARKIGCNLDVIISKKITPPDYSEYAIGAIMYDGTLYKSKYWPKFSDDPRFKDELTQKQHEVKRRLEEYRGNDKYLLEGKYIILVDDGIATGSTVFAILNWIKKQNPKQIILAVPVIPITTFDKMKSFVDEMIVLDIPEDFSAVGQFYDDFSQVTAIQVKKILKKYHN
jgi:predicted phosphoribosyltransferase